MEDATEQPGKTSDCFDQRKDKPDILRVQNITKPTADLRDLSGEKRIQKIFKE